MVVAGLGVRVRPSGYRSYVYRCRKRNLKVALGRVTLKSVAQARRERFSHWDDEQPRRTTLSFGELAAGAWKHAVYNRYEPSTRVGANSVLNRQLLPNFGSEPLRRPEWRRELVRRIQRGNARRGELGAAGVPANYEFCDRAGPHRDESGARPAEKSMSEARPLPVARGNPVPSLDPERVRDGAAFVERQPGSGSGWGSLWRKDSHGPAFPFGPRSRNGPG